MALPVGEHVVPDKPLQVNDDLVWDNGASYPEPCIDRITDTIRKYEAFVWLFFCSFKLRTEQRGRVKEEEFMKKVQEMMMEEEKLRIPIAQGLPWTTGEPEVLQGEIRAFLEEKEALKNRIMIVSTCKSKHVGMYHNKSITSTNVI